MDTPSSGSDSRFVGNLYLSIKPRTGSTLQSFALSLDDYDDLDNSSNREVILRGLTEAEAQAFFDRVCQMLETGTPLRSVRSMISDYVGELDEAAVQAQEVAGQEEALRATTNAALLKASRFFGRETVNGIVMSVAWYEGLGSQYEIYFPQKENTIVIGQNRNDAEIVFNYARIEATMTSDVDVLYAKVEAFIHNDYQEIALPSKTLPPAAPRLQPTTLEVTVNGIRIVLGSNEGQYYLTLPDANLRALRNKVNPGDGHFYISRPRLPNVALDDAKELATSCKDADELFIRLWNRFR